MELLKKSVSLGLTGFFKFGYNFKIVSEEGLTNIDNYNQSNNGCLHLPTDIDKQFGGKYITNFLGGFLNS